MELFVKDNIPVHILSVKPDIKIWYAEIPNIISGLLYDACNVDLLKGRSIEFKPDDFRISCINPEELDTINSFKALKKQIEWMCGRYVAKQMVQKFFFQKELLHNITISYHNKGAPFIAGHPDISISISHSNDMTAAACSMNSCKTVGLDVEKIGRQPDSAFLKIAFTNREIEFLKKEAASIFLNWTIKEAYLKYIKMGFHESLHKVEIINDDIRHHDKKVDVDIFSKQISKEYILSLVSGKKV